MWPFHQSDDIEAPAGIIINEGREDAPRFERTYRQKLDNRASIEITIKTYDPERLMKSGTLTQPNGKRVFFEPDAIADRIIDPVLVPLVQKAVDEIFKLDSVYRKPLPDRYTDKSGTIWCREKAS